MKGHFKRLIIPAIILAAIVFFSILGITGDNKDVTDAPAEDKSTTVVSVANETGGAGNSENESAVAPQKPEETKAISAVPDTAIKSEEKDKTVAEDIYATPAETVSGTDNLSCSLSVRCDNILSNMDKLKKEKVAYVPSDGKIYENAKAVFHEGESAFNLLIRELRSNNIHYEFVRTPIYNSSYIEGIGNLYEFDCGEQSGWTYKVNGISPGYGCSQYKIKNNDVIEFIYICSYGT